MAQVAKSFEKAGEWKNGEIVTLAMKRIADFDYRPPREDYGNSGDNVADYMQSIDRTQMPENSSEMESPNEPESALRKALRNIFNKSAQFDGAYFGEDSMGHESWSPEDESEEELWGEDEDDDFDGPSLSAQQRQELVKDLAEIGITVGPEVSEEVLIDLAGVMEKHIEDANPTRNEQRYERRREEGMGQAEAGYPDLLGDEGYFDDSRGNEW